MFRLDSAVVVNVDEKKRENWNLETVKLLLNLFGCLRRAAAGIFINKAKCLSDAVESPFPLFIFSAY